MGIILQNELITMPLITTLICRGIKFLKEASCVAENDLRNYFVLEIVFIIT